MRHTTGAITLFAWISLGIGMALVVVLPATSGPYADVSNMWILGCVFVLAGLQAILVRLVLAYLQRGKTNDAS